MNRGRLIQLHQASSVEELSDVGLIAACAAGDRAARSLLFERHVEPVHRFVTRMRGADSDAVDDLVQITFLRAFGASGRFRGTSARSWLFGIAANVVKEHARSEIRRKQALGAAADVLPRTTGPRDPLVSQLPQAIAGLRHDLRAALVLIDLEGERGSDAAAALGIPEGTLWRRVYHARVALRDALEGAKR